MEKFWEIYDGFVMNLALAVVILAGAALIAVAIAVLIAMVSRRLQYRRLKRMEKRKAMPWKYDPVTLKRLPKRGDYAKRSGVTDADHVDPML